jgi:4-aminobutyrate aminotransferase-like enzyme/Ser/Thr protein kinase RdoA (MazF antagonist)
MSTAEHIALERYGLQATAHALAGEKDLNFRLIPANAGAGSEFVLKLSEPIAPDQVESLRATLAMQAAALTHAAERVHDVALQRVVLTVTGQTITSLDTPEGTRLVRLLTYLPGRLWAHCNPHTPDMLRSLGRALGEVDAALASFAHPAAQRDLKWDLAKAAWVRNYVQHIASAERRAMVETWLNEYETCTQPKLATLRQQVIYNDANDYNVILLSPHPQPLSQGERGAKVGLIDFGDVLHSTLICDLAIACAYAMLGQPDPLSAAKDVVAGFHQAYALQEAELEVLLPLITMRLCVSVVNSAWQRDIAPDNDYLQVSARPAWDLLAQLEAIHPRLAHYTFRAACGLPAVPHAQQVVQWLNEHADEIGPVVLPDLKTCPKIYSDWSVGSLELGSPDEYDDAAKFTRKIWARIAEAGVNVAIGGYNHARPVYGGDAFRIPTSNGYEWRTVHLGLDVFMDAGTPVYAPLDGVVHSFAFNDARYDYGPCIVLKHDFFYTLYGHLTLDSLDGLYAGRPIKKGEAFAKIGPYPTNGDWPPHLHLQLICDMLDKRGDFDGSCRPSQRDVWLSLCPDPNLIAQIPNPTPSPSPQRGGEEILIARRDLIGYNLSVSYKKKLHIVRGWKQWLYDADGQRYLDGVNNVAHVGHCHPRVVQAGQRQMAVLNTNTRYLHELLTEYARRLTATLPEPLRVCFFVNSGSEANELALRLARAHTRQKDMLVVDVGYHGNTTGIVDISPYKHNHAGGMGAPDWVHTAEMPDVYRGRFGPDDPQAGPKYAAHLSALIERIGALPPHYQSPNADIRWQPQRGLAGFICEGVLSCGGQIVLPPGYLREAYRIARSVGGVCIADEVQTGFGRVGSHFWAFETQGVTPDIVTMGKPMGNGHSLGAVVTTPEIAASFNNGLEYFNTFGGNPVSCAIGLAVLDVIADEGLQAQALRVGNYLTDGLRALQGQHAIIGDVRGLGLFCGFELVRDRATKTPATEEASTLVNRVKEHGILLSTDGPFENVIKIKPPLCFDEANADFMLATLDKVLREDAIRV